MKTSSRFDVPVLLDQLKAFFLGLIIEDETQSFNTGNSSLFWSFLFPLAEIKKSYA